MHHDGEVRTTLDLPKDLHDAARSIARDRGSTMSEVVAELVRRGLGQSPGVKVERSAATGLPVIRLGRPVTQNDVRSLDDDG